MSNPAKPMSIWHGEYVSEVPGKELAYADRDALKLVADKTGEIKLAGGSCAVSRNFGLGPAIIVLVVPTIVQPVQFFDPSIRFTLKATIGAPPSGIDSQIKEVTGSDVRRPDSPESTGADVEQSGGESTGQGADHSVSKGTAEVPAPQPANADSDVQPNNDGNRNKNKLS